MPAPANEFRSESDVIIIGGGVIGLAIGRALGLRGAGQVAVVEKGEFGREASWAAGGILAPQVEADAADDFFRLLCASRDRYHEFTGALANESDIDVELDDTGTMCVAFTEREQDDFRARFAWQRSAGLNVEWLTGSEARDAEPSVSQHVCCALRFPDDLQVENRRLVDALVVSNRRLGVQLTDHCAVTKVRVADKRVEGIETSRGLFDAATVVIAAGAWSAKIDPAGELDVEPVRGQMLCFRPAQRIARHVIYSSRGYLIPRRDGRLIAGSTSEQVGFDKRTTSEGVESIKAMAAEIAPALAGFSLADMWAGFRPRAHDGLPVLGASTDIRGLFYATGHFRNGILLAPITGELMADALMTGAISPLLAPFSPARRHTLRV